MKIKGSYKIQYHPDGPDGKVRLLLAFGRIGRSGSSACAMRHVVLTVGGMQGHARGTSRRGAVPAAACPDACGPCKP